MRYRYYLGALTRGRTDTVYRITFRVPHVNEAALAPFLVYRKQVSKPRPVSLAQHLGGLLDGFDMGFGQFYAGINDGCRGVLAIEPDFAIHHYAIWHGGRAITHRFGTSHRSIRSIV